MHRTHQRAVSSYGCRFTLWTGVAAGLIACGRAPTPHGTRTTDDSRQPSDAAPQPIGDAGPHADPDTSGQTEPITRQVWQGAGYPQGLTFSKDGSHLAFVSNHGGAGEGELHRIQLDTGAAQRIHDGVIWLWAAQRPIAMSDSGDAMIYRRRDAAAANPRWIFASDLYYTASGGSVRVDTEVARSAFRITADGRYVVYVKHNALWLWDAASGQHRQLAQRVVYSPYASEADNLPLNANHLAYVRRTAGGLYLLHLVDLRNGADRVLASDVPRKVRPAFVAGGSKLSYAVRLDAHALAYELLDVATMRRTSEDFARREQDQVGSYVVSPSARYSAYLLPGAAGQPGLLRLRDLTSQTRVNVAEQVLPLSYRFSADGRYLFYLSSTAASPRAGALHRYVIASGRRDQVADEVSIDQQQRLVWNSDSQHVAYCDNQRRMNIWHPSDGTRRLPTGVNCGIVYPWDPPRWIPGNVLLTSEYVAATARQRLLAFDVSSRPATVIADDYFGSISGPDGETTLVIQRPEHGRLTINLHSWRASAMSPVFSGVGMSAFGHVSRRHAAFFVGDQQAYRMYIRALPSTR